MAAPTFRSASTAGAASSGTTVTLSRPADTEGGDLLEAVFSHNTATLSVNSVPTGWTLIESLGGGTNVTVYTYRKIAGGSAGSATTDPSTYDWGLSSSLTWQGGIAAYSGPDTTTPLDVSGATNEANASDATIACPDITTTGADRRVTRAYGFSSGAASPDPGFGWFSSPAGITERFEAEATSTKRPCGLSDAAQASAGATGAVDITSVVANTHVGMTIALSGVSAGTTETLRPTGVSGLTNLTGAATDIDQDPDDVTITDAGLVGSDPSGTSGLTNGPEYVDGPATATAWSGATGITWGTYANVIDTSEATSSTTTLASTNTDYQSFLSFSATDFSDIPAGSTITGVSVTIRHTVGTANRLQTHLTLATANGAAIGNELNAATNTTAATTQAAITNTEQTVDAFSAMPSRAELISGTFGVRLRARRSNTAAWTVFSVKATVTYTGPGSTVNTQADVALGDPIGALATGAATGEIRALMRKRGTGSNPTATLTLRDAAGSWTQAITFTQTGSTTATLSSSAWALFSGTFNQSVITDKTDVVARFVGTGAAGGLAELGPIEWNAQVVAGTTFTVTHNATATVVATHSKQVQVTRTRTSAPVATHVKQPQKIHAVAEAAAASYARQLQALRTHNATATGTGIHTKQPQVKRTATETATATATASKVVLRTHNATVAPIATAQRTVQIIRNAAEAATATHSRQVQVARAVQEAAIATHAASKVVLRSHSVSASVIATATRQAQLRRLAQEVAAATAALQITARRAHNATATGTPTATRQARIGRNATSAPVGTQSATKVLLRTHNATAAPVATYVKQPQIRRTAVAAPIAVDVLQARIARAVQAAVVATHIKEPRIARSRTSVPVGAHTSSKVIQRSHASVATGLATSSRAVKVSHNALAVPTPTERLTAQIRRQALAVAQPGHTPAVTLTIAHSATSLPLAAHALTPGVSYYAQVVAVPTYAYLVQAAVATIPRVGPLFTFAAEERVRVMATPRASVGTEGDYGGSEAARIYPSRRVRVT